MSCILAFILFFPQSSGPTQAEQTRLGSAEDRSDIPEGFMLIDGDVLVPTNYFEPHFVPNAAPGGNLWPNGVVPYELDSNIPPENQTRIIAAMSQWESCAGVEFRLRSNEWDYVHIQMANANNSMIGRVGGRQVINLFTYPSTIPVTWDWTYIFVHELGHCLGLYHEQQRPDRDNFIRIEWANVLDSSTDFFRIDNNAQTWMPYDIESVMHYGDCAGSRCSQPWLSGCPANCRSMTALVPEMQAAMGQRTHLSPLDRQTMGILYPPYPPVYVDQSYRGPERGTPSQPYREFLTAINSVGSHRTFIVRPGNYTGVGICSKPMTVVTPEGGVTLR